MDIEEGKRDEKEEEEEEEDDDVDCKLESIGIVGEIDVSTVAVVAVADVVIIGDDDSVVDVTVEKEVEIEEEEVEMEVSTTRGFTKSIDTHARHTLNSTPPNILIFNSTSLSLSLFPSLCIPYSSLSPSLSVDDDDEVRDENVAVEVIEEKEEGGERGRGSSEQLVGR